MGRAERGGEQNGREYWFLTEEDFDRRVAAREVVEPDDAEDDRPERELAHLDAFRYVGTVLLLAHWQASSTDMIAAGGLGE